MLCGVMEYRMSEMADYISRALYCIVSGVLISLEGCCVCVWSFAEFIYSIHDLLELGARLSSLGRGFFPSCMYKNTTWEALTAFMKLSFSRELI